jgi:hypothetical protein
MLNPLMWIAEALATRLGRERVLYVIYLSDSKRWHSVNYFEVNGYSRLTRLESAWGASFEASV